VFKNLDTRLAAVLIKLFLLIGVLYILFTFYTARLHSPKESSNSMRAESRSAIRLNSERPSRSLSRFITLRYKCMIDIDQISL
jgi:hypothetical protein